MIRQIRLSEFARMPFSERKLLAARHSQGFRLAMMCSSIGNAAWNVDIAHDYIVVSYIGQRLSKFANPRQTNLASLERSYSTSIVLEFEVIDEEGFAYEAEKLRVLDEQSFSSLEDEVRYEQLMADVASHADAADSDTIAFPEIYDAYLSNELVGRPDVLGLEEHEARQWELNAQPTRKYGFIRSAFSYGREGNVYISPQAYLMVGAVDVHTVLNRSAGVSLHEEQMLPCSLFRVSGLPEVIANGVSILRFSRKNLCCTNELLASLGLDGVRTEEEILGTPDLQILFYRRAELCLITFSSENEQIGQLEKEKFASRGRLVVDSTGVALGSRIALDWSLVDDEMFEVLCYDIIRLSGRFLPESVRKMGHSRSSDGGRDLVMMEAQWPGHEGKLWLGQCKLVRSRPSVGIDALNGVLEALAHYGAGGYCLLTSGLVDSRVWDRIVALSGVSPFKYDVWDRLRIERFLRLHPDLREEYFGKS